MPYTARHDWIDVAVADPVSWLQSMQSEDIQPGSSVRRDRYYLRKIVGVDERGKRNATRFWVLDGFTETPEYVDIDFINRLRLHSDENEIKPCIFTMTWNLDDELKRQQVMSAVRQQVPGFYKQIAADIARSIVADRTFELDAVAQVSNRIIERTRQMFITTNRWRVGYRNGEPYFEPIVDDSPFGSSNVRMCDRCRRELTPYDFQCDRYMCERCVEMERRGQVAIHDMYRLGGRGFGREATTLREMVAAMEAGEDVTYVSATEEQAQRLMELARRIAPNASGAVRSVLADAIDRGQRWAADEWVARQLYGMQISGCDVDGCDGSDRSDPRVLRSCEHRRVQFDSYYQERPHQEATSGDSFSMRFDLEHLDACYKKVGGLECGEPTVEGSDLCQAHHDEIRAKFSSRRSEPKRKPFSA